MLRSLYFRRMEILLHFIVTPQLSDNKDLINYNNHHFHQELVLEQAIVYKKLNSKSLCNSLLFINNFRF
jgi:hypothetical protein